MSTTLNDYAEDAYDNSAAHGFWDDSPANPKIALPSADFATYLGNKLMLIVGEVAEAHEELRKDADVTLTYHREDGKPEGFVFELADVLIRVFDLFGALDLDPELYVRAKMDYNSGRPSKHGKLF